MQQQGLQFDKGCELAFIHVCQRACHEPAALQHLLQLRADGCTCSTSEHSARIAALQACRAQGHWQLAVELLSEMQAAQQAEYPHYRCAVHACAESGQWGAVVQLLQAMHAAGVQPRALLISSLHEAVAGADAEQQRDVKAAIEAAIGTAATAAAAVSAS
jgi:pentatricopeptide repeat protein